MPVVESILLTGPLSCLQKNGSSDPIQYLSFILLFGCCLRFEGKSPSVTQGLHVYMRLFWSPCSLLRPSQGGCGRLRALQAVSQYLQEGRIKQKCRQWGNSYRQGSITCPSVQFPVATVNWRGFPAFRRGRREKNKLKAVN